jgi:peroxiredoxin
VGEQIIRKRRGRTTLLAAAVLLPIGALGIRLKLLTQVPVKYDSESGLRARLETEGDDSVLSQYELERRNGDKNLDLWLRVLKEQNSHARYLAADAITNTKSPEGGPILAGLLKDYNSQVRTCAVESLGAGKYKESIPVLVAALADEDTWVRESAIGQLILRRDPKTVPALIKAIHDPDRVTANQAIGALRKITRQPFKSSFRDDAEKYKATVAKWDGWWATARNDWPADTTLDLIQPVRPERIGPQAWDFDAETIGPGSKRFRLSDCKGKLVLLNFFATYCGPCIVEAIDIQKAYGEFGTQGVEFLALEISAEKPQPVLDFAAKQHLSYPMALAPSSAIRDYGHIHDVPRTFLIDRQGRIRYQWDGQRDYDTFALAIRRLLAEK